MVNRVGIITLGGIGIGIGSFFVLQSASQAIPGAMDTSGNIVHNAEAFIAPASQTTYSPIRDFNIPEPQLHARSGILIDGNSHRVLFAKNPDQKLPIASITKLMTALVVLEDLDINQVYTVTAEDLNIDGNGADFTQGEQLRGTELMKIMLVKSSNDAASVFATSAYRDGVDFVGLMNQKAARLGMSSTHFSDPAGLNDAETYSTASDVGKLVRAAMQKEFLREVTETPWIDVPTLEGTVYHVINTNLLLSLLPDILLGKTGNTTGALGTMALAIAVDGENYLISVVLGSEDRFGETKKLIDWGKQAHTWN
ncbi:MAG: serine hydrolase [Patescibacteria group bacterium]